MAQGDITVRQMECCGTQEVTGISYYHSWGDSRDGESMLRDILTNHQPYKNHLLNIPKTAHLIFTQARDDQDPPEVGYGWSLKKYIEEQKLGSVVASEPGVNPNTGNYVTVFVWRMDRDAIYRWANSQTPAIQLM